MLHPSIGQPFLEFVSGIFEPLASCLNVIYADTDVTETFARVGVAIGYLEVWVVLRSVIMREFQDTLPIGPVSVWRGTLSIVVREEVETELVIREVQFVDLFHA